MDHEFSRTELLIGTEGLLKLQESSVAVFGLGGVGSYVVEALVRSGISHLLLIDHDEVNITNLNRQLIATHDTIGRAKVDVERERILSINPSAHVETFKEMYLPGNNSGILRPGLSYIIDAVDNVTAKLELAVQASLLKIPIISSMGTGNKLDPTKFEIADIYETSVCPLSRVMRCELRKRNISNLKVLYSQEEPRKFPQADYPASISFVPPVAGLIIAGEVIKDIIATK